MKRLLAVIGAAATLTLTGMGVATAFPANPTNGAVAAGDPAAARCAPITGNDFTGTVLGADGLGVNVTIGFDITDASGNEIDLATGCAPSGYGAIVQLNHDISGEGAPLGTPMTTASGAADGFVSDSFALDNLPANAAHVWIEVYSRAFTGSKCGWSCAGNVDTHKYGFLNRREVPIVNNHVDLSLPLTPAYGGSTGALSIRVAGGTVSKLYAWSMLTPDGSRPDQGWGIGVQQPDGSWLVPSLGSGQTYVAWAYTDKGLFKLLQIPVAAGQTTTETIDETGPATVDLTRLPTHRLTLTRVGRQGFTTTWKTNGNRATLSGRLKPTVKPGTPARLLVLTNGRYLTVAKTTVSKKHTFALQQKLPYQGKASWRVVVGSAHDTLGVTAS